MNILFINPPQTFYPGSNHQYTNKLPPLGLLTVAGFIKSQGHNLYCVDALRPDYEYKLTDGVVRLGMSQDQLEKELAGYKPDIIGISNLFTNQFSNSVFCSKICKKVFPDIPIVIGGCHPSVAAEEILRNYEYFDIVVQGEGELTFAELLNNYDSGFFRNINEIDGIAYRDPTTNQIHKNNMRAWIKNLDILPFPAYELVDMEYYFKISDPFRSLGNARALSFITSRGCPYKCNFCSIHLHMGSLFRVHSVEYIIKHLEWILTNLSVKHISFEDDGINLNLKRIKAILKEIIRKKLRFTWNTPNGLRVEQIDEEFLQLAKKTGVRSLKIGIESGCQRILSNVIKKNLNLDDVIRAAALCKRYGVPLEGFFIIGFPGETLADMKKTLGFKKILDEKYNVAGNLSIATPLLGTALYKEAVQKHLLVKTDLTDRDFAEATQGRGKSLIRTSLWTPEDIEHMQEYDDILSRRLRIRQIVTRPIYSLMGFWKAKNKHRLIVNYIFAMLGWNKMKRKFKTRRIEQSLG